MKWFKFMLLFVLSTVLVGSFASNVAAQSSTTGAVSGSIVDASGGAVPGATVTLTNKETDASMSTVSDNSGAYTFPIVPPADYVLTVEKQNFRKIEKPIAAVIGQNLTNNFKLEVGNVSEVVQVEAAPPLLQVENANLATTFESRQIENLPNGGNDMSAIANTAPGVLMNTSSGGGYGNFTAFGLPATSNLFTINGNDANDPYLNLNNSGATNLQLGTNEVQEVAVISNAYTVQYGRQAGAQIDYATKSGANVFHGNAVYWYNSGGMNANDFFNNATSTPLPHLVNNQWAWSVGGPIKKDKAFFFIDQEGLRYILGTSNQVVVPTPEFASAVLANMAAGNSIVSAASVPFYKNMFDLYNNAPGISRAKIVDNSFDPSGNLGCGDLNTDYYVSSYGFYPTPVAPGFAKFGGTGANALLGGNNNGGGTPCSEWFRSTVGQLSPEWTLAAKMDVNFNDANHASIRYRMDRGVQATYTDPISPIFNATSNQPEYEGQINWNHIFSSTKTNQLIVSGLWYGAIFGPESVKAQNTFPGALYDFDTNGWANMGGDNNAFPQGRNVSQAQVVDDFNWAKGNHSFKFGGNFRYNKISDHSNAVRVVPRLRIFSTTNFAEGVLDNINQRHPDLTSTSAGIYSLGLYFMDEWRVTSSLKLTLGIRSDRNSNGTCYQNCFARLYTTFPDVNHDPTIPYNQLFASNLAHAFPDLQPVVWQPRVGFAWTPNTHGYTKAGTTVIRGGVGMFSDLYPGTLIDSEMHNAPLLRQYSISTSFAPSTLNPNGKYLPLSTAETSLGAYNAYLAQTTCDDIFTGVVADGGTRADYRALSKAALGYTCPGPDYNSTANKIYNPMYIQWNLQIQQAIGSRSMLSVNYVGNHGYNEFITNPWINGAQSGALPNFVGLPAAPPETRINNVVNLTNGGYSNYNGLAVNFTQRQTKGLSFSFNYTYSHTSDIISNGGILPYSGNDTVLGLINPNCFSCNYASSDYDVRHNVSANYVWQLPFKFSNKMVETVAGGWQVSGTVFYRSGLPFSVNDPNGAPLLTNSVNGTLLASPVTGLAIPSGCSNAGSAYSTVLKPCLTNSMFLTTTSEANFSSIGRNYFRGPGYFNSDFSILKNFHVTERVTFALGANMYNVFNHANWANPVHDITSGQFGLANQTVVPPTSPYGAFTGSAVSGREIQITGRITF